MIPFVLILKTDRRSSFALLLNRAPLVPLMAVCLMLLYGIAGAYQPAVQASIPLLAQAEQPQAAVAHPQGLDRRHRDAHYQGGGEHQVKKGQHQHDGQKDRLLPGAALLPGVPVLPGWWGVTAMSFAIMVLSTMLVVVLSAAAQGQTPPDLLGKVMAFIMAVSNCAASRRRGRPGPWPPG